jgi:hypothetical protein
MGVVPKLTRSVSEGGKALPRSRCGLLDGVENISVDAASRKRMDFKFGQLKKLPKNLSSKF